MKTGNKIALTASAVVLVALVAWALQPRPVVVESAEVTAGVFELSVVEDGRTRVRERYTLYAPLAGRLERIRLKAGDPVARGQTVAWLTPVAPALLDERSIRELQARVATAEAQQLRARAEVSRVTGQRDQASADLSRSVRLWKEGFISAAAREQAELALHTADKSLEAARFAETAAGHELAQSRAALAHYRGGGSGSRWPIASPVQGTVLKIVQESESTVTPGAALIELADARSLEAVVDVLSQDAVAIRPGMPARLELGKGAPPLAARVRLIEPSAFTKVSALGVEEQRVNVLLDFVGPLDKITTLGDGFRVEAQIVTRREENVVKVPVGALFREGDKWAVFRIEQGRALKTAIQISERNSAEAWVAQGLRAGDRVVVYPSDTLRDGAKIKMP